MELQGLTFKCCTVQQFCPVQQFWPVLELISHASYRNHHRKFEIWNNIEGKCSRSDHFCIKTESSDDRYIFFEYQSWLSLENFLRHVEAMSHDSLFIYYVSEWEGFWECETIERRNFSASQIWVEGSEVQILFTLPLKLSYFDMLLLPSAATWWG